LTFMTQLTATAEDAAEPRVTPKASNNDRVVNTLIAPPKKYCIKVQTSLYTLILKDDDIT